MAIYNIEMNVLNSSGSYDILYPRTISNDLIWETGRYTGTGQKFITITYSTQNATPLFISILSKNIISQDSSKIHKAFGYTGTIPLANYDGGYDAYYGTSITTMDAEDNFSSFPVMFRITLEDNNSFTIFQLEQKAGTKINIINATNVVYDYCLLLKINN